MIQQGDDTRFETLLADYHDALARGEDESRFFDSVPDISPELRARLEAASNCVRQLHAAWRGEFARTAAGNARFASSSLTPEVATWIGRFRIVRELGRGGAGLVLLGIDPKLGRHVAVKVPLPEILVDETMRQRFLREAEIAARLSHPHLLTVHESGEAGPVCYIASEFCAGPNLADWLRAHRVTRRPSVSSIIEFVIKLADAVQYAHTRGVLHRDLKPSNILLVPAVEMPDESGDEAGQYDALALEDYVPKVADFGLGKLVERDTDHTRTGMVLGTLLYMSPEQAAGRVRDISIQSDQYALGAILYELLTGEPPFQGESDLATLHRILSQDPTPPRRLARNIPLELESICLKCLEKEPADRYATVGQLADDLRRHMAGLPTEARPPRFLKWIGKWIRRHPVIAALALASCCALVAIFTIAATYNHRLSQEIVRANTQRDLAHKEVENSRRLLYSAEMRLAYEAFQTDRLPETLNYLKQLEPRAGQADLREFSWYYLQSLCGQEERSFLGHQDEVYAVAYSPDGRQLATAGKDGTCRIWDVSTGECQHVLYDHQSEVDDVAFSPDGAMLASCGDDWVVRLWDSASGAALGELRGHTDEVYVLAFSPDGRSLVSGGLENAVRIWNVATRELERAFETVDQVTAVAYSPNGEWLVASDYSGLLRRWRCEDWQEMPSVQLARDDAAGIAFSDDSSRLAVVGRNEVLRVWECNDGELHTDFEIENAHTARMQSVAFSPTQNAIATGGWDGVIRLWSWHDGKLEKTILAQSGHVRQVAWSPDGAFLASAGADGEVKLWDVQQIAASGRARELPAAVWDFDVLPDGQTLVLACADGYIRFWDVASRAVIRQHHLHEEAARAVRCSPNGAYIVSRGDSGRTKVWSTETGELRYCLPSSHARGNVLAWNAAGDLLATTDDERTVCIIDALSGTELARSTFDTRILNLLFWHDQLCVTMRSGGFAWKFQLGTAREPIPYVDDISPDGTLFAGTMSGGVTLSDVRSEIAERTLVAHKVEVNLLDFSPDGRTLAAAKNHVPFGIVLFDVRTGQELTRFDLKGRRLNRLKFLPAGNQLIGVGEGPDGIGAIWEWSFGQHAMDGNRR